MVKHLLNHSMIYLVALVLFNFAIGTGKAAETEPSQILSLDTCFRSPFSSYDSNLWPLPPEGSAGNRC